MYCVCCWVSPILKTDPSLSVNQASAKIKDKLFLAGFEYKHTIPGWNIKAGSWIFSAEQALFPFDERGDLHFRVHSDCNEFYLIFRVSLTNQQDVFSAFDCFYRNVGHGDDFQS